MIELMPSRAILLSIGSIDVHWYGIMYFLGFIIGITAAERLQHYRKINLSSKDIDHLLFTIVFGVVVGGRLGYVLFWDPRYFLAHPSQIFAVWHGGMSSHGGMLLTYVALRVYCRVKDIDQWRLGDVVIAPIAFALGLGRIGNFINQELYGTVTTLPWGMHFPGADGLRHPAQLYGLLKDWTITAVLYMHLRSTAQHFIAGRTLGYFFVLYGFLRFLVEYVREQPEGYYHFGALTLSYGQLLTIPVFVLGIFILWLRSPRRVMPAA